MPLAPAIEANGQFLFHEFVERVHRKIGGDDDGQARSVVHVGERSHIFEGLLVRGLAVAGCHGVEGLGQGDVGGVLFKAEGVADRSALQHVDGAAGIAVVDQLADPGEADIPCAAEHRAAHGPEVDGFGVFSRGWGGEGEREAMAQAPESVMALCRRDMMDSSGYVGRGPVEGLRARARKLGGSGGAEPLLACDLDEKDEAGRAEADEVGEEAGVHEHDPGHEHRPARRARIR